VHEIYNKSTGILKNFVEFRQFRDKSRQTTPDKTQAFSAKLGKSRKKPGKIDAL